MVEPNNHKTFTKDIAFHAECENRRTSVVQLGHIHHQTEVMHILWVLL